MDLAVMQLVHGLTQVGHILHLVQLEDVKPEWCRHQAVIQALECREYFRRRQRAGKDVEQPAPLVLFAATQFSGHLTDVQIQSPTQIQVLDYFQQSLRIRVLLEAQQQFVTEQHPISMQDRLGNEVHL